MDDELYALEKLTDYQPFLSTSADAQKLTLGYSKAEGNGLLSQWTGRPDPSLTFTLLYGKGSYFNSGRQEATPEITKSLADSRASADLDARKKAFSVLQKQVLEQALSVPLLFQFELDAHSTKVKGFQPNLLGKPRFNGVWLDG